MEGDVCKRTPSGSKKGVRECIWSVGTNASRKRPLELYGAFGRLRELVHLTINIGNAKKMPPFSKVFFFVVFDNEDNCMQITTASLCDIQILTAVL